MRSGLLLRFIIINYCWVIYVNSKVNAAIKKADKLMYEGKKSKRSVVVKKTSGVD